MGQLTTDYRAKAEQDFEIFYEAHQVPIVRYLVVKWLFDEDSAYDLCQETFKRFWKFLIDQETALQQTTDYKRNWLYKVARNLAIDKLRRKELIVSQSLTENEMDTQLPEQTAEGELELIDELLVLQEAIAQMSPKYCESLRLSLSGNSYQEIAAILGGEAKTVSANVSRAKAQLYRKIYPVTLDLQRAQAMHADQAVNELLKDIKGVVHVDEVQEQWVKALDWQYRRDMRQHLNELRNVVFLPDMGNAEGYATYIKGKRQVSPIVKQRRKDRSIWPYNRE